MKEIVEGKLWVDHRTGRVRVRGVLSYPHLVKPYQEGQKLRTSLFLGTWDGEVAEPDKQLHLALRSVILKFAKSEGIKITKMKTKSGKTIYKGLKWDKTCLRTISDEKDDPLAGCPIFSASKDPKDPVRVFKKNKAIDASEPSGGDEAYVVADLWALKNQHGPAICSELLAVSLLNKGHPFGVSQVSDEEIYEALGIDPDDFEPNFDDDDDDFDVDGDEGDDEDLLDV